MVLPRRAMNIAVELSQWNINGKVLIYRQ